MSSDLEIHLNGLRKQDKYTDFTIYYDGGAVKLHKVVLTRENVGLMININSNDNISVLSIYELDIFIKWLYLSNIPNNKNLVTYISVLEFILMDKTVTSRLIDFLVNKIQLMLDNIREKEEDTTEKEENKYIETAIKHLLTNSGKDRRIGDYSSTYLEFLSNYKENDVWIREYVQKNP